MHKLDKTTGSKNLSTLRWALVEGVCYLIAFKNNRSFELEIKEVQLAKSETEITTLEEPADKNFHYSSH